MPSSSEKYIGKLGIVIAAGGSSDRYGKGNKLFEKLSGIPIFIHCIKNFMPLCLPENMVLSCAEKELGKFKKEIKKHLDGFEIHLVKGGSSRTESVYNGICALPETVEIVAVHDAARPFASAALLQNCVKACKKYDGAIAARHVTDTVKRGDEKCLIKETLDRSTLWTVETPQVFVLDKLKKAYQKALKSKKHFTDDAGIMEYAEYRVCLVENPDFNIKITYQSDLKYAARIMNMN